MDDLINRLRVMVGSDTVPMEKAMKLLLVAVSAIEAAGEDAERYRWLRGSHWYVGPEPDGDTEGVSLCDRNDGTLDAAIDAAREASNG